MLLADEGAAPHSVKLNPCKWALRLGLAGRKRGAGRNPDTKTAKSETTETESISANLSTFIIDASDLSNILDTKKTSFRRAKFMENIRGQMQIYLSPPDLHRIRALSDQIIRIG